MFGLTPLSRGNSLSTFNPFAEMDELERQFFGSHDIAEFKTDIRDNGKEYILEADLPGFKKEDIHISAENGYLTIRAERKEEIEEKRENAGYIRRERSYGSFARSFDISYIDEDRIKASFKNGVLKLVLPKQEQKVLQSRKIEIE